MRTYLRILFFLLLLFELVFSFSLPDVWQYPVSGSSHALFIHEENISAHQRSIFSDFCFFELVENEEQKEEKEENEKQRKDELYYNNSVDLRIVLRNVEYFLVQQKNYRNKFLVSPKISLLVLFHTWKFHI